MLDSAYGQEGVRDISFWTSCDDTGVQLDDSRYWDDHDDYKPVEDPLTDQGNIQNLCYMVHQFDEVASGKLANIHGDESVAAVRIAGSDGNR